MKKLIFFLLAAILPVLSACGETVPAPTAVTATEETAVTTVPAPETQIPDLTGKEQTIAFFSEEGTLEKKGTQSVRTLAAPEDLDPYAAYFSETDLAAVKEMLNKDGETLLAEVFVEDPTCLFHLQSVAPEAGFTLVSCQLEHPEPEEEEIPSHGHHLFFVIHLDEEYRQGLPLRFVLTVE